MPVMPALPNRGDRYERVLRRVGLRVVWPLAPEMGGGIDEPLHKKAEQTTEREN